MGLDAALSAAESLKYTRSKLLVAQDVDEPSDEIVRHYAAQCYDGKLMARVTEMFRPIVKRAFAEHVSDQITKRLESVRIAAEVPAQSEAQAEESPCGCSSEDGIVTHNTEEWAL